MLNQLFSRNRMILHLWGGLLEIASSEEQIRSGMDKMQKEIDCAALYFLASDGSCMTQDGEEQPWLVDRAGHASFRRRGRRCERGAARKAADARVCLPGGERH